MRVEGSKVARAIAVILVAFVLMLAAVGAFIQLDQRATMPEWLSVVGGTGVIVTGVFWAVFRVFPVRRQR